MSADQNPAHSCAGILTDSARKRNRREVCQIINYNKTTINRPPT
jgi:HD superfamily phosphohydrolase YqeK